MDFLTVTEVMGILREIGDVMQDNTSLLVELDSGMGDGDLGLTMSTGFRAVCGCLDQCEGHIEISELLGKCGMAMASAVPSTMGTLTATAMMRAGISCKGKQELYPADLHSMLRAAIAGIENRGKAARGEKTILDSLYPAAEALEEACDGGMNLEECLKAAYAGAVKGLEETKQMVSVHGKAAVYGEKTLGRQDPGATVGMLFFKGIDLWYEKQKI